MHNHLSWILYLGLLCLAAAVCRAKQVCTFSEVVDSAGSTDDWKGYKVVQNPDKCKTFCRSFDWCTAAEFDFSSYSCYLYGGATSLSHKKESVYMKIGCTEVTSPPTSVETRTTTASPTITESSPSTFKYTTPSRTSTNVPTIKKTSPSTIKGTTPSRTSINVPTITESSPSTIKDTSPSRTSINVPTITESTPSTVKDTTPSRTSINVSTITESSPSTIKGTSPSRTSIYVPTITESTPSTVKDTTPSRTSINDPAITESSPSTVKDTTPSRTFTNDPTITESSPSTVKDTTPSRTSINVPTITESTPSTLKDTTPSRTSINVPTITESSPSTVKDTTVSSITSIYVPTITESSLSTIRHTTSASTSTTDMTQMVESGVIMPSRAAGNTALFRQRRTSTQATTTSRLSNLAQTNSFVPFLLWLRCRLAPTDIYNVATTTTTTTTAADSELVQTPVGSVRTETPLCQIDTIHAKNDRLCFNIDKFINWKFHVPGKTPKVFLVLSCDRCKPLHVSVPARCKGVVCFYVSKRGTILHVQEDHCKMPKSIFYQPQFPPTQMKKTAPQYASDVSSSSLYPSRKDNVLSIHQDALYQMEPIPVNEAVTEGLTDPPMSNASDVSLNSSDKNQGNPALSRTETVQHDRVPNVTASTRHGPQNTFEERAPRPKVKEAQFHSSQTIAPSKQTKRKKRRRSRQKQIQRNKRRRSRRRRKGKHPMKKRTSVSSRCSPLVDRKQRSRRRKSRKNC